MPRQPGQDRPLDGPVLQKTGASNPSSMNCGSSLPALAMVWASTLAACFRPRRSSVVCSARWCSQRTEAPSGARCWGCRPMDCTRDSRADDLVRTSYGLKPRAVPLLPRGLTTGACPPMRYLRRVTLHGLARRHCGDANRAAKVAEGVDSARALLHSPPFAYNFTGPPESFGSAACAASLA